LHIVLDNGGRFVEVEDDQGRSVQCPWREREDGCWELVIRREDVPVDGAMTVPAAPQIERLVPSREVGGRASIAPMTDDFSNELGYADHVLTGGVECVNGKHFLNITWWQRRPDGEVVRSRGCSVGPLDERPSPEHLTLLFLQALDAAHPPSKAFEPAVMRLS
jgi:hypothetical protein